MHQMRRLKEGMRRFTRGKRERRTRRGRFGRGVFPGKWPPPGNANLPIGPSKQTANREIGVPMGKTAAVPGFLRGLRGSVVKTVFPCYFVSASTRAISSAVRP